MLKSVLIKKIAGGIIEEEGLTLTPLQAEEMGIKWPCIAQICCNPGNIRDWADKDNKPYPKKFGYVDYLTWAKGDVDKALKEALRTLLIQVGNYIDGKLHGFSPTLLQMFEKYAPAKDKNIPETYAKDVGKFAGIPIDKPLNTLVS